MINELKSMEIISTTTNKYFRSKFINKKNIKLKNYKYLVEVINNLTLLIPDRILKVEITEYNDKLHIIEENDQTLDYSDINHCKYDKNKIFIKLIKLLLLLSKIISMNNISVTLSKLLIKNNEKIIICDWYEKLLYNGEVNESEFNNLLSTLFYSIIEENQKERVYKSIYELVKTQSNQFKFSKENLLNKIMLNKIMLEEIELELENEYESDYVKIKETELKELNFYYGSYHPIESLVKNWIDIEIKNIVSNNSEQIKLWNCISL